MAKCMLIREDYETFNPQSKILKKAEFQKPPCSIEIRLLYSVNFFSKDFHLYS